MSQIVSKDLEEAFRQLFKLYEKGDLIRNPEREQNEITLKLVQILRLSGVEIDL